MTALVESTFWNPDELHIDFYSISQSFKKPFYMVFYLRQDAYFAPFLLGCSEITTELVTFNHLSCHSSCKLSKK